MPKKDLWIDRLLLTIAMLVFFIWGFIYKIAVPGSIDPPSLRISGTILIAAILILSFLWETVKNNLSRIIYVLCFLFTLHEAYIVYLNRISTEFVIDYIVLILIFNAYFKKPLHLLAYIIFSLGVIITVYYFVENPASSFGFIISSIVSIDCLVFPILSSRLIIQQRLQYSEALMKSVYEESTDSIFIIEPHTGKIVGCNSCAAKTFGKNKEQIIEKDFYRVVGLSSLEVSFKDIEEEVEGGKTWKYELERNVNEKELFWGDVAVKGIVTGEKKLWVMRITDITLRKIAELRLKAKTHALESSNTELEQMAYVASHDLQEPLRSITSYVQLLRRKYEDKLDEEGKEFIGYTVEGAERMRQLINDLLTYSRIGSSYRKIEKVDCNHIIRVVLNNLSVSIKESSADITVKNTLPVIRANEFEMIELFQNLLSNAIKFRGEKAPRIEISATFLNKGEMFNPEGHELQGWLFAVKDNGIGIHPEYSQKIFMIFQRLHTRDQYGGTGIGLAICKKIVDRYNGEIWVESKPHEGSTFCFTINTDISPILE
jgi:PAS domain S-box-containing protein